MNEKKITKKFDRLIMGAIIGGAIGSVIGVTLSKKNKDNKQTETEKKAKSPSFLKRLVDKILRKHRPAEMKEIPSESLNLQIEEEDKEYQ